MTGWFPNQEDHNNVLVHRILPICVAKTFTFYRCISMDDKYYGKTVSELFEGNLREGNADNRYSQLFPGKKVSYWADSPKTARAEIAFHNPAYKGLLTFWAYDDATSTLPVLGNKHPLYIVDGRDRNFENILKKHEAGIELNASDRALLTQIDEVDPDCLVYQSLRRYGGLNFMFFENGFKKLAVREVRLRYKKAYGGHHAKIICADGSDYSPILKNYGQSFELMAKVKQNPDYVLTDDYMWREQNYRHSLERLREGMNDDLMETKEKV